MTILIRDNGIPNVPSNAFNQVPIHFEPVAGEINLDIGAGVAPILGFEHVDKRPLNHIEHVIDVERDLLKKWGDSTVHTIYTSHFIEHVTYYRIVDIFRDMHRILKGGGTLEIHFPDFLALAHRFIQNANNPSELLTLQPELFGAQLFPDDVHKGGYTEDFMKALLKEIGFKVVLTLPNKIDPFDAVIGGIK